MKGYFDLRRWAVNISTGLIGLLALYAIYSMVGFGDSAQKRQPAEIEEIIRKAAVQCYALEGEYPPNINYLADNYGIVLNEEKYYYYYGVPFGLHFMPDIAVTVK